MKKKDKKLIIYLMNFLVTERVLSNKEVLMRMRINKFMRIKSVFLKVDSYGSRKLERKNIE